MKKKDVLHALEGAKIQMALMLHRRDVMIYERIEGLERDLASLRQEVEVLHSRNSFFAGRVSELYSEIRKIKGTDGNEGEVE